MRLLLLLISLSSFSMGAMAQPAAPTAQIFLTSAAINVLDDLVPLLPPPSKTQTDCYVVTASNLEGNPSWVSDEIAAIERAGRAIRPVDLAKLDRESVGITFSDCAVIWVGGGNTFYLLQEVRRSGFDQIVAERVRAGIPYVGTSAGAIIVGPDIESAKFADDMAAAPGLTSYEGLNLFPVIPYVHFDNPAFKDAYREILTFALSHDINFVTVKERQFIAVQGDHWRLVDAD